MIKYTNEKSTTYEYSEYSLPQALQEFINNREEVLFIKLRQIPKKAKVKDPDKVAIQKFYNSKYSSYSKKFKSGKITESEFTKVKQALKDIKSSVTNIKEFETEFKKYQNKQEV